MIGKPIQIRKAAMKFFYTLISLLFISFPSFAQSPYDVQRFVYTNQSESTRQNWDHIYYFNTETDVIDVSGICHGQFKEDCTGPYHIIDTKEMNKGPGAVYYMWIPGLYNYFTAVFGDFDGTVIGNFYIPIEGGKLKLTKKNFYFGNPPTVKPTE